MFTVLHLWSRAWEECWRPVVLKVTPPGSALGKGPSIPGQAAVWGSSCASKHRSTCQPTVTFFSDQPDVYS